MPTYEYVATEASGQAVRGLVHGATLEGAAASLAQQGLTVTHLTPAGGLDPLTAGSVAESREVAREVAREVPGAVAGVGFATEQDPVMLKRSAMATNVWGPLAGQVPLKDLLFFFRQGGTMLEAGVPIVQSMATLAGQSRSPKLATIVRELEKHVQEGRPISFGLQRYPEVFNTVILSIVRAGERGGFLDKALSQVADYLEREIALRNLYKRLTFYPKLQVWASIIIVIGANLIISSINSSAGQLSSPLTTPSTWIWLGPLIVAIFLFLRVGLAQPPVRYAWDTLISNLPYVGKLLRELAMARFGRAFGALYRAGVPITDAMKVSADACGNEYLRAKMYPAARVLETGAGVTETLRSTEAFSPIVLDMIATGEQTGSLDQMLNKMSEFYEDETATKSTQLAQVVGVVLGLLVAIYIGYVVINFYSGYFGNLQKAADG